MATARSNPAVRVHQVDGRGQAGNEGRGDAVHPRTRCRRPRGTRRSRDEWAASAQWLLLRERRPFVLAVYEDVRGQHAQLLATSASRAMMLGAPRAPITCATCGPVHPTRTRSGGPRTSANQPRPPGQSHDNLRHAPRTGACPRPRPALRPGHSLCPLASAVHAAWRRS
jgi:hypothetical protein